MIVATSLINAKRSGFLRYNYSFRLLLIMFTILLTACKGTEQDQSGQIMVEKNSDKKNGIESSQSVIIFFEWDMHAMDLVSGFNIENLYE